MRVVVEGPRHGPGYGPGPGDGPGGRGHQAEVAREGPLGAVGAPADGGEDRRGGVKTEVGRGAVGVVAAPSDGRVAKPVACKEVLPMAGVG